MKANITRFIKKRPKSKEETTDQCNSCPANSFVDHGPHPSILYSYQSQPPQLQHYQQHPPYQHQQQPMQQMQLSPCPHHFQPQQPHQQIIHSPQPIIYPTQSQFRNNTFDSSGPSENGIILNNQIQQTVPSQQHLMTNPAYNSQVQSPLAGSQSPRSTENHDYINQNDTFMLQQQHQQQQHQQQQQQHQQQQHHHHQQHHSFNEQRLKQQQLLEQQHQQQHQYQHQSYQQLNQQPQQQHFEIQQRQALQDQQQNYQNHPISKLSAEGDGDLALEVKCYMHDQSREHLAEFGNKLWNDLSKRKEELEIIQKEAPSYSVKEEKI